MNKAIGPGPKYMLPPTIGYNHHDVSRYRNPQYTMGINCGLAKKQLGPGPKYALDRMTRFGKATPPAYSLASRPKPLTPFQTPAPGRYKPELVPRMKESRPPVYSMSKRLQGLKRAQIPGPNQYDLPSTIGPKVPDLHANAAYTMGYNHGLAGRERSPGPAKYGGIKTDIFKNKQPQFTISPQIPPLKNKSPTPGPAAYLPELPHCKCNNGYSFGLRTGRSPYITADDNMPCTNR